jgi:hypothetical protein
MAAVRFTRGGHIAAFTVHFITLITQVTCESQCSVKFYLLRHAVHSSTETLDCGNLSNELIL